MTQSDIAYLNTHINRAEIILATNRRKMEVARKRGDIDAVDFFSIASKSAGSEQRITKLRLILLTGCK